MDTKETPEIPVIDYQTTSTRSIELLGIRFRASIAIKAGQLIFWDEDTPVGVARRDIAAGADINYIPSKNTNDVITTGEVSWRFPPELKRPNAKT